MFRSLSALLMALLLSACDNAIDFDADASPPQLRRDGRWLVDPQNRVVLLHGVNLVWKVDPYVPPATACTPRAAPGPTDRDLRARRPALPRRIHGDGYRRAPVIAALPVSPSGRDGSRSAW
jgi:hypothetical protein